MNDVILKIFSDIHCEVYLDGEFQCLACKDIYTKLVLRPGEYDIELVSTYNSNYRLSYSIFLEYDKIIRADFIAEAKRHIDWHKDGDFVWYEDHNDNRICKNLITSEVLLSKADAIVQTITGEEYLYFLGKKDGMYALLDAYGHELTPYIYESIKNFSEGLAPVVRNGCWGFINNAGKEIIPCKYKLHYDPEYNHYTYKQRIIIQDRNGNYGMINNNNETIIPFIYKDLYFAVDQHGSETSFIIGKHLNGERGVLNLYGTELLSGNWQDIRIQINKNSTLFLVATDGEWVETNYKYGLYDYIDAQWGLYNIDGVQLAPCIYDRIICNEDGGIIVVQSERYGLINTSGETIAECKYDKIRSLESCRYRLQLGNKYGIVDIYGNEISSPQEESPTEYQEVRHLAKEKFAVKQSEKLGIVNSQGQIISPCQYDIFQEAKGGGYIVCRSGHTGLLDKEGNELLPCIYDEEHEEIIAEQAYGSPYRNIYGNADFLTFTIKGEEIYYDVEHERSIEPYRVIESKDAVEAYEFCANKACYYNGNCKILILEEDKQLSLICVTVNNADKYGLRNIEGTLIVREQYTFISRYYNGYQAWSYGNCDFYDKYGNLLLTSVPT